MEATKLDIACRVAVNYLKAGEVTIDEAFPLRDLLLKLPMEEVLYMLADSHEKAEECGLPVVYRLNGIMN